HPIAQASNGFDRKCVFSTFQQGFICIHLFYSYLARSTMPFPLSVQHLAVARLAPRGGLFALSAQL
ncbi:MAG: hypothetical protein ACK55U_00805, partial [Bacteroidota bacterium]